MAVSFQCMTKSTTKKKNSKQKNSKHSKQGCCVFILDWVLQFVYVARPSVEGAQLLGPGKGGSGSPAADSSVIRSSKK